MLHPPLGRETKAESPLPGGQLPAVQRSSGKGNRGTEGRDGREFQSGRTAARRPLAHTPARPASSSHARRQLATGKAARRRRRLTSPAALRLPPTALEKAPPLAHAHAPSRSHLRAPAHSAMTGLRPAPPRPAPPRRICQSPRQPIRARRRAATVP